MPEINDVLPLETIETQWGNAIRDRTVQRYVDNTERDNLTPFPAIGELAYITSTDQFQIWDGLAWIPFFPTTGGVVTGSIFLHNSFGDRAGSLYAFDSTGRHILMLDTSALGDNTGTRIQMYSDIDPNTPGQLQLIAAENGIRILESSLNPGVNPPQIRNLAGTVTRPSYTFQNDQNSGMYSSGTDSVGLAAGGARIININAAGLTDLSKTGDTEGIILNLGIARSWSFEQFRTGASAALRLWSSSNKDFFVGNHSNAEDVFRVSTVGIYAIKHPTTASAANGFIDASGGLLRRSTSSLAVKKKVKQVGIREAKRIVRELKPITFESKLEDDEGKKFMGFGAEEVTAVFVEGEEEENYDVRAIVSALTRVVQELI